MTQLAVGYGRQRKRHILIALGRLTWAQRRIRIAPITTLKVSARADMVLTRRSPAHSPAQQKAANPLGQRLDFGCGGTQPP
jgi:hypothetical protein